MSKVCLLYCLSCINFTSMLLFLIKMFYCLYTDLMFLILSIITHFCKIAQKGHLMDLHIQFKLIFCIQIVNINTEKRKHLKDHFRTIPLTKDYGGLAKGWQSKLCFNTIIYTKTIEI